VLTTGAHLVFERSAIVKQIASTGADPVNDEPLSEEELIAIKSQLMAVTCNLMVALTDLATLPIAPEFSVPRAPNATSLPALLKSFQDEWVSSSQYINHHREVMLFLTLQDASMCESFELKRQNQQLRQGTP
jgi:pre-mRNA-processing factor 19